jgi:transcriptional regulator with XRE-family HTH domain
MTEFPGKIRIMTTQEVMPAPRYTAPTRYSEIIRDEVKAECGRRGISQRELSLALGLSQQSVSDRARGRIPWTLDEVERLEPVLGLDRGALLFRCARRDSNPQPSDLSPLEVLLAVDVVDVEWDDEDEYRRGQCVICSGDCDPGDCVMYRDALGLAA